jgi:hypothetical protein
VLHSEITSAADGEPSNATMIAPPMAAKRDDVMAGSRYGGRGNSGLTQT